MDRKDSTRVQARPPIMGTLVAGIVVGVVVALVVLSGGCGGALVSLPSSSTSTASDAGKPAVPTISKLTAETNLPAGIMRIVGQSGPIWVATSDALLSAQWEPGSNLGWLGCSAGTRGERVALWSQESGQAFLWEPTGPDGIVELYEGAAYEIDDLWMSPLETRLVINRYAHSANGSGTRLPHVYLVDLAAGRGEEVACIGEAAPEGSVITSHAWTPDDSAVLFSVGELGGDAGFAVFRYDIVGDRLTELDGLSQVWAAGPQGEVLGCSTGEPIPAPNSPAEAASRPCVVWRDGALESIAHDPRVELWSGGIMSPDGRRVAIDCRWREGGASVHAVEVLVRRDGAWELEFVTAMSGVASLRARGFAVDGTSVWLEKGIGEFSSGESWLCRLSLDTGEVGDGVLLPFPGWGAVRGLAQSCDSG